MTDVIPTPVQDTRELYHDLKTLALFIDLYCRYKHPDSPRTQVDLRTHDVKLIAGKTIVLCPECTKLLAHAFVKRSHPQVQRFQQSFQFDWVAGLRHGLQFRA